MHSLLHKPHLAELAHQGLKTETRRLSCRVSAGQLAYIRETFRLEARWNTKAPNDVLLELHGQRPVVAYEGSPSRPRGLTFGRLRTGMHMPEKFARTVVVIEDVRWEPLQSIDEESARREGFDSYEDFRLAWWQIQGRSSWADNPNVAVIRYRRIRPAP